MRAILISILFFGMVSFAFAKTVNLQASDHNKPILVKSSAPEVMISLPSNRTTGYSWFLLSYNSNHIEPVRKKFNAPTSTMLGAPGESVWTFRVLDPAFLVPQVTKITMIYARPWDLSDARKKVITIITQ